MKTIYYTCVTRDEERNFNYSTGIEIKHVEDEDYNEYKFDEKPLIILQQPLEHNIAVISYSAEHIECFRAGISFEQNKYDMWGEMYDKFIDLQSTY